jgi:hypothetical protein
LWASVRPPPGERAPQGAGQDLGIASDREDGLRLGIILGVGETNGTGEMNREPGKRIKDRRGKASSRDRAATERELAAQQVARNVLQSAAAARAC